ncbi:MAG TPA: serine hydrolase domain-containing protein [Arenimonas sp.]|uniref:serine hydrolase domain-containing protein n=1 Tax=Arenimonas sp. TaxID=1872635 RepID=UPI002D802102|nr:serine hydrolase domain-containing protein [Arenimonas sp.]HEU0153951.1 serine hydrolase domain-containing protein [Arenimonas sp.]
MNRSGWLAFTFTLVLGGLLPGVGAARPAYDLAPVQAAMRALVADYRLDGASLRLAREGGQVVMLETFGSYRGDERVAIASASKWLSALVLGRLVERGTLAWDSRVGDYFPEAAPAMRPITLAQLFSHTAGMDVDDAPCLSVRQTTLQACAAQILAIPLVYAPGTGFAYGGNSMQVAGAMAERATGEDWDTLFLAEVVQPLGLTGTDWSTSSLLPGYVPTPNPRIAGGARATRDDYARVVDMVLATGRHGEARYLREDTIAAMAIDRAAGLPVYYAPDGGIGYGYGIGQWVEAKDAAGHTLRVSSPGAFGFTPWVDWRQGSNGVLLVRGNGSAMRDDLTAIEQLALQQLDFRRSTQSVPKPETGGSRPEGSSGIAPARRGPSMAVPADRVEARTTRRSDRRPGARPRATRSPGQDAARLDAGRPAL